jgi:hypothetical protein
VIRLRILVILAVLFAIAILPVLVRNVNAGGYGIWKNTPPSLTERLRAYNQDNSTQEYIPHYTDAHAPSIEDKVRFSEPTTSILLQASVLGGIAILVVFAVYLKVSEKSPEQAMMETEKLTAE